MRVAAVDLDLDSDNDGQIQRSAEEEAVENDPNEGGKFMGVNDGDVDGDGVPDFADGFDKFGNEGDGASDEFVPLVIEVPEGLDPERARLRFTYNASDPDGVTRNQPEGDADPTYSPALGLLRLWTVDGPRSRRRAPVHAGGDYVPPDRPLRIADLPAHARTGPRTWRLFIEAVAPSQVAGDAGVKVELAP